MASILDDELGEILTRMATPLSQWERDKVLEAMAERPVAVAYLLAAAVRTT